MDGIFEGQARSAMALSSFAPDIQLEGYVDNQY